MDWCLNSEIWAVGSMNSLLAQLPLTSYSFLHAMSRAKWMCSKWHYRFPQCYPVLKIPVKAEQQLPETRKGHDKKCLKITFWMEGDLREEKEEEIIWRMDAGSWESFCHQSRFFRSWGLSGEDEALTLCRCRSRNVQGLAEKHSQSWALFYETFHVSLFWWETFWLHLKEPLTCGIHINFTMTGMHSS